MEQNKAFELLLTGKQHGNELQLLSTDSGPFWKLVFLIPLLFLFGYPGATSRPHFRTPSRLANVLSGSGMADFPARGVFTCKRLSQCHAGKPNLCKSNGNLWCVRFADVCGVNTLAVIQFHATKSATTGLQKS